MKPDAAIQSGSKWGTAEDLTAAEWMFDMVKTIAPSARKPNFAGWANDIRLMRERDGRNHRDMCVLFRWACQDNFWSGNVLKPRPNSATSGPSSKSTVTSNRQV